MNLNVSWKLQFNCGGFLQFKIHKKLSKGKTIKISLNKRNKVLSILITFLTLKQSNWTINSTNARFVLSKKHYQNAVSLSVSSKNYRNNSPTMENFFNLNKIVWWPNKLKQIKLYFVFFISYVTNMSDHTEFDCNENQIFGSDRLHAKLLRIFAHLIHLDLTNNFLQLTL